jgi:Copper type II ascorbate-dependent monooxygenase, C-terminal domain/Copper type II ascorbate-dependent monooxygenase, N-terminal domain
LYHSEKPKRGQIKRDSLPDPMMAIQPVKSLLLLQRSSQKRPVENVEPPLEIRNEKVKLSALSPQLLKSCHAHKVNESIRGNHIVRYEPVFSSAESSQFISLMRLYECKTSAADSEADESCNEARKVERRCLTVAALWTRGSEGFTFPKDVGYPITDSTDHFLLEVHYQFTGKTELVDSSGFRIYHTRNRRKFDAGTLSIAIRHNFLHIIAPGFKRVISVAHCTSNCTQKALAESINVFGVNMQTHSLGRKIKVGVVRNGEEIEPLALEASLDAEHLESRVLEKARNILPGDHITVECTYNTFMRSQFTLGGESSDEEVCAATLMYYPRQEQLVSCYSQSNVATLLSALGIESLR